MIKVDILIVGGGLTGLTLAYLLKNSNLRVVIVEARDRLGGRILTVGGQDQATVEMGATWLSPTHTRLLFLSDELGLNIFHQKLGKSAIYEPNSMSPHQLVTIPREQQPSFRIEGGTSVLTNTLASHLEDKEIQLSERVKKISLQDNSLKVVCSNSTIETDKVVSTLPPKLIAETIEIEPSLPKNVLDVLSATHTWMGESIKFGLTFDDPFWLKENTSSTVFSDVGPINEMYDHTTGKGNHHAIKGFLNASYSSVSKYDRLRLLLQQLRKYYGTAVYNYRDYYEMVWANEVYTYTPYSEHILPHQNNGHKVFRESYLDHRFYIAGAETSEISPGYMDGAVYSAHHVFNQIISDM